MRQTRFVRQVMTLVAAVVCGAVLSNVCSAAADDPKTKFPDEWFFGGAERPAPLRDIEGKPAAALAIDSWIGDEVSLSACKGKVVLIDFWATWCGPCMNAIPHNVELVKKYKDRGLVFVGVHDSASGWDTAPQVVKDTGINYSVGVDKGGASVKSYAVQFWPTYIAVDRAGIVRAAGLTPNHVDSVVEALLAEKAPEAIQTKDDEFGPEVYYGGKLRPSALRSVEGKLAPALKPASWLGAEASESVRTNSVVVLTFVSPSLPVSLAELKKLIPLEQDLRSQGAVFVGVCDGNGDWAKIGEFAKGNSIAFPLMRDSLTKVSESSGKPIEVSATAAAFGIEFFPTTVILDRTGKVRAAGVRANKVKEVVEKLLSETVGAPPAGAALK